VAEGDTADGESARGGGAGLPGLAGGEGLEGLDEGLEMGGIRGARGIERPWEGEGGTIAMHLKGVVLKFGEAGRSGEGVGHDQRASSR